MTAIPDLQSRVQVAVHHFRAARDSQFARQGNAGDPDRGARAAVTAGKQMDGFVELTRELLCEFGADRGSVHCERRLELPGWYRAEKRWDLIVISDGSLIAGIEFKSQMGPSFGNNFNNRTEEALGSATDVWAAYREGAFQPSARPWLGYIMLLEEAPASTAPVRAFEPHFRIFPEFRDSSYATRYEILLTKMVRERLYDSACLILTAPGDPPSYREPSIELSFEGLIRSLLLRLPRR